MDFIIEKGKTYGLVGESGSGKSTTGKAIVGLEKITSGEVIYEGQDVTKRSVRKKNELQQGCSNDFSRFYVKSES